MKKISKEEMKILYGIAASAGLVDNSNHNEDGFHQIVYQVSGKSSVRELTQEEYRKVKSRLKEYISLTDENTDGMITIKQKRKIYAQMIELSELSPSEKSRDERLCGIVRKTLKISSFPSEPLKWVKKKEATKLIQIIGFYIETERNKLEREDMKNEHG